MYDTTYSRKMSHVNRDNKNNNKTMNYSGLKMASSYVALKQHRALLYID